MRTLLHTTVPGASTGLIIALLSGTFGRPEDFVREGFPAQAAAHGIAAEIAMAEVRAAWFADGSVVQRIRDHVVLPAIARGQKRIWLAGISLGALASLSYAARHESDIEGILLISPYPATREVLLEMEAAGGPGRWHPAIPPEGDLEREAWRWLAGRRPDGLPVHCYFASGDRFAPGQRLMAQLLPPACVREVAGGHDWETWRRLWDDFLSRSKAVLQ
jgi:pimeloyl-ACP methyl ester carboxylesterase